VVYNYDAGTKETFYKNVSYGVSGMTDADMVLHFNRKEKSKSPIDGFVVESVDADGTKTLIPND